MESPRGTGEAPRARAGGARAQADPARGSHGASQPPPDTGKVGKLVGTVRLSRLKLWIQAYRQRRQQRQQARLCRQALASLDRQQKAMACLLSPILLPSGPAASPSATPKRAGLAGSIATLASRLNRWLPSRRPGDRLWLAYHRHRRRLIFRLLPLLIPKLYAWYVRRFLTASRQPARTL